VHLLGALSELFTFTALRFNTAHSTFKIDGTKLTFPDLVLRGANSAIDAHGDFLLDRRELDFKANIYPFQESGNPLKTIVGAVLTPFSNIFEVKLTGTLDKPAWTLLVSPTNLFRSTPAGESTPGKPTPDGATPPVASPPPPGAVPPAAVPSGPPDPGTAVPKPGPPPETPPVAPKVP
ncbi:MAG: hypothetical protein NTV51_11615, partial [Verrucomicrobia bacterium]|nr:hypothetical protein [Verrucomicrobiota bacterium]